MNRTTLAWSFQSPFGLEGMRARLESVWESPWTYGDSALYGDYLAGRLSPEAVARIFETGTGFLVQLRFYSERGPARAQLDAATRRLLEGALPLLEAIEVTSTEPLD